MPMLPLMTAAAQSDLPDIITIIDDDIATARSIKYQVEDLSKYKVQLITSGSYDTVGQLFRVISDTKTCVLCDHRLTQGGLARFTGAEFVAHCNRTQIPALLITQFSDQDTDVSIRRFRRHVPILLPRHDLTPELIEDGLKACWSELHGQVPSDRTPHRTLVEIVDISSEGGEDVADAIIPAWRPDTAVRFPLSSAALLRDKIKRQFRNQKRVYLFAQVNIGAFEPDNLFFEDFEIATLNTKPLFDQFVTS